jgi:hypothetical protein
MTDEQYQEMMGKLYQGGKITAGQSDITPESEMLRRVTAGMKAGLLNPVEPVENPNPKINQAFSMEGQDKYKSGSKVVYQNTQELLKLGVPMEKLQPFILKRREQESMMRNLERRHEDTIPILSAEERQLGLDPTKYTTKAWNPADYIGWSKQDPEVMKRIADEMRLKAQQEAVLGPEVELSPEQIKENKKRLLMKAMGLTESDQYFLDKMDQSGQ